MPTKQNFVSKDSIRTKAISAGMARPQAWVFAIIAFWSQHKGGVQIGSGHKFQWRDYKEISDEIGYSTKSVGRAVSALGASGLIEFRRIWHPVKLGQSVNAFRLTMKGRKLLDLPWPSLDDLSPQNSLFEKDKNAVPKGTPGLILQSHPEASMNMEHTGKMAVDSATHSQVGDSAAETIKERFGKEYLPGGSWSKISKEHVYNLWKGYKWMIRDVFSKPVGNYNAKREQWLIDYLRVFEQEDYRPVDAIIALAKACTDWSSCGEILATYEGKPHFAAKEYPDPYTLGVYGHVFLDFYVNYENQLPTLETSDDF